jgi:hypothetical protein
VDVRLFLDLLLTPAIFSVSILGFMVGAFYGYPLDPLRRPQFPWTLFVIGMASIVAIGIAALFDTTWRIEAQWVRAILWTLLCVMIPVGRWTRQHIERWRIGRTIRKQKE